MVNGLPCIGPHRLAGRVILAPMAGITDRPFRQLCRTLGAGLVVSEMVTADKRLWHTPKSRLRLDHSGEPGPRSVQIAGGDAAMLADAARVNADNGAEIIDINMGCPAKKVCNKAAGSALMRDEALVAEILERVVSAVDIPVTLKIRTGWCDQTRNALTIARMAESAGIAALSVHGRTREQRYQGLAEYDTIARIKSELAIPVFANGDVDGPEKARQVLDYTGADAVMVGRAAQGNPWIFREIEHHLENGSFLTPPTASERAEVMTRHLEALYALYGEHMGVRIARKHIGWYLAGAEHGERWRREFNTLEGCDEQQRYLIALFAENSPFAPIDGTRAA
ncbi:tRNA dihydrouridine synthase DusB [Kushneria indalinina]|uniref:tRNA-dihydrouridine synthase B n=1 Tax=Kushneria indalinina DSM 14324 TaxID=1122140 RepID=A0A3D9DYZ6_9GAMM|nr:tRNA dihydrouridine synthase DusB [Kushneria indalinina]REC96007.1 tRNA-U20-dihydrouridine synthase [Kushneria indalinina DSM 14324]